MNGGNDFPIELLKRARQHRDHAVAAVLSTNSRNRAPGKAIVAGNATAPRRQDGKSENTERTLPSHRSPINNRLPVILVRNTLDLHRDLGHSGIAAVGQ